MSFRKTATTVAVSVAVMAMSTLAHAAPVSPASRLSVASATTTPGARVGAAQQKSSKLGGGNTIIIILAALAVAAGIAVAVDGGDSDSN